MIPKIIHFCWFGKNERNNEVKYYIETWKKMLPDYEIIEWNESNFDVNMCKFTEEAYETKKYAFVSDVARLYVLYQYGGIYMDVDMEVLDSFDKFLNHKCFLGYETAQGGIASCIIGAEKGHPIFKELLSIYQNKHFILSNGKYDMRPNTLVIEDYLKNKYGAIWDGNEKKIEDLYIYDWHVFHSLSLIDGKLYKNNETVAIHRHTLLWVSWKTRLIKYIRIKFFIPVFGIRIYQFFEKRRKR